MLTFLLVLIALFPPDKTPQWRTYDEARTAAQQSGKPVMIAFYADWCRYCKQMDRETFTDERVLQLLKKDFIAVRINVESDETLTFRGKQYTQRQFARLLRASSLPTTSFLDAEEMPITYQPGMVGASDFVSLLSFIGSGAYKTEDFETFIKKQQ
jgi:thioredoxin-related protein